MIQMTDPETMADLRYLQWLKDDCGYRNIKLLPDGRWGATNQFLFTCAILVGQMRDAYGYADRWCYASEAKAREALEAWDGTGEPTGWHRHPDSGRRRPDGDPAQEYVNL